MQTRNPILDDISRVVTGAAGVAQAAGEEIRALAQAHTERLVSGMDLARRDETEAVKTLLRSALERIEALEARVADLEGKSKEPS